MSDLQTVLDAWIDYADALKSLSETSTFSHPTSAHLYRLMAHAGSSERILHQLLKTGGEATEEIVPRRSLEDRPGRFQGPPNRGRPS